MDYWRNSWSWAIMCPTFCEKLRCETLSSDRKGGITTERTVGLIFKREYLHFKKIQAIQDLEAQEHKFTFWIYH